MVKFYKKFVLISAGLALALFSSLATADAKSKQPVSSRIVPIQHCLPVHILTSLVGSESAQQMNIVQQNKDGLEAYVSAKEYKAGDIVVFGLINNSKKTVFLPNTAPWRIVYPNGRVEQPYAPQVRTPLQPGEKLEWKWQSPLYVTILGAPAGTQPPLLTGFGVFTIEFYSLDLAISFKLTKPSIPPTYKCPPPYSID